MNFGYKSPLSRSSPSGEENLSNFIYTADEYKNRLRKLRQDFAEKHFKLEFINMFKSLAKKSSEGKLCREEMVLTIDEDLDKDSVISKISLFINDCGYSVHIDQEKESRRVKFTIAI